MNSTERKIIKMALSRKHFKELAVILGQHKASIDLNLAIVEFCLNHNRHFKRDTFLNAIEKASQEIEQAEKKWSVSNIVNDKEFFLNK
tara:strand:- start:220 stop:483 length:264 start_codon:yes stop_codon:yes gene_type:complete